MRGAVVQALMKREVSSKLSVGTAPFPAPLQLLLAQSQWSHYNQRYWHAVATSQGERAGPVGGERGWVSHEDQL